MEIESAYAKHFGVPDFRVRYRWTALPGTDFEHRRFQHMRCDFAYAEDDFPTTGAFMIWPEFEASPNVVLPHSLEVPLSGTATMWIVNPDKYRNYHASRIRTGTKGYLVVGGRQLATTEVTDLLGLAVRERKGGEKRGRTSLIETLAIRGEQRSKGSRDQRGQASLLGFFGAA